MPQPRQSPVFQARQRSVNFRRHVFEILVLDRDGNTMQRSFFLPLHSIFIRLESQLRDTLLKRNHGVVLPDRLPFGKNHQPTFTLGKNTPCHLKGRTIRSAPNDRISAHSLHRPSRQPRRLKSFHGRKVIEVQAELSGKLHHNQRLVPTRMAWHQQATTPLQRPQSCEPIPLYLNIRHFKLCANSSRQYH